MGCYSVPLRLALFFFLCIPLRLLFTYVAYKISAKWLPFLAIPAIAMAIGFAVQFARKPIRGQFGGPVWWHWWRLVHLSLLLLFASLAIFRRRDLAWRVLLADVAFGLLARLLSKHTHD